MKTLNDVINAVQHETKLPRYKISLKIGKSKNYLSEVLRSGVSPKKEQEIINLLLNLVDDETTMLRNQIKDLRLHLNYSEGVIKEKDETIETYKTKLKEVINENLDIVKEKNDEIATKNLFIDGLDMENKGLMDNNQSLRLEVDVLESRLKRLKEELDHVKHIHDESVGRNVEIFECNVKQENTIQSMEEVMRELGIDADRNYRKNRFLTASIIGLVAIFSVYAFLK